MIVPPYNAPDPTVPYLRWVREQIEGLLRDAARRAEGEANSNRSQNATITRLGEQIRALEETDTRVDGVIARLIDPVSAEQRATSFTAPTAIGDVAIATVVVPADCTRAIVTANASAGLKNGQPTGWSDLRIQSRIAGVLAGPVIQSIDADKYGSGALSQSTELAGLVPGSTFEIAVQMAFGALHSNANASVSALITFAP